MRRSALTISTIGLLCLFTALTGAASAAPASGIKGDPQPELKPFVIGGSNYMGASVAMEPSGALVVARGATTHNGQGEVIVCVLARGAGKCSSSVTLHPLGTDDLFGVPEVFVPAANHVSILMGACCDTNPSGSDLLFTSTDGGKTFAAPKRVGTLGVDAATLIKGNIVFTHADDPSGTEVESIPVGASGPPTSSAVVSSQEAFDVAMGSYKNGLLVASDFLGTDYTTHVWYAAAGQDFNAHGSYKNVVGKGFSHEQLIALSGGALLTVQTTGKNPLLLLRLFNGTSFGAAHAVPGIKATAAQWFTVNQDPRGVVHVFSEWALSSPHYYLFERSTTTGLHWTGPVDLGNAIRSNDFAAALDASGSGLVVGTDANQPAIGYPVLAAQSASFSLKSATIRRGSSTTASGTVSPVAHGREVELQVEKSGLWYTVATTHESSTGRFSFTIKGAAVGTFSYRAVVLDLAGYVQFGYSAVRSLRVTS